MIRPPPRRRILRPFTKRRRSLLGLMPVLAEAWLTAFGSQVQVDCNH